MMNFELFVNVVVEKMNKRMDGKGKVVSQKIAKNNGVELTGLVFQTGINISPVIHVEMYYSAYQQGTEIDLIVDEIWRSYELHKITENVDVQFITEYESVKSMLFPKLISYEQNRRLLRDMPYRKFLDMAIVYYLILQDDKNMTATVPVRNDMITIWGIDEVELYRQSFDNMQKRMPVEILDMKEFITSIVGENIELKEVEFGEMYIMTNGKRCYGSVWLCDLENWKDEVSGDMYILPSSVHELVLLPANKQRGVAQLKDMVKEVNLTLSSEQEILSDNVYYYSKEEDIVRLLG